MHIGNWAALAITGLLLIALVVANARSRRRRRQSTLQHRAGAVGGPKHDQTSAILIGKVAADGARSSLG